MKIKKKLLFLTVAALMAVGCSLPASAASTSFELEPVKPCYTVTIPEQVTLSRQVGEPKSITIEVSDVNALPESKKISVTIAGLVDGTGQSVQQFYLCDGKGDGKVPLTISPAQGTATAPEDNVIGLELAAFSQEGSAAYQVAICSEASDKIDYQATILYYEIGLTDVQ